MGRMNVSSGIHFAPGFIANRWQSKTFFLNGWKPITAGGFSVTGFGKNVGGYRKGEDYVAFLPRFGGGSGGYNNIYNDGMGATATGNRHHNQRI
jgi:hypothetical protein